MCWDHLFARTTLHDPASAAIRHVIDTVGLLEFVFGVFRWQCWVCFCGTCCGVCLPTLVGAGPAAQIALLVHSALGLQGLSQWHDLQGGPWLDSWTSVSPMKGQSDSGFADVEKASEWCYLEWLYHVIDVSALQCQCHWPLPAVGLCCHGCQRCLAVGAALAADWEDMNACSLLILSIYYFNY